MMESGEYLTAKLVSSPLISYADVTSYGLTMNSVSRRARGASICDFLLEWGSSYCVTSVQAENPYRCVCIFLCAYEIVA